jgi:hypothetical protein
MPSPSTPGMVSGVVMSSTLAARSLASAARTPGPAAMAADACGSSGPWLRSSSAERRLWRSSQRSSRAAVSLSDFSAEAAASRPSARASASAARLIVNVASWLGRIVTRRAVAGRCFSASARTV